MKLSQLTLHLLFLGIFAIPLMAQTQIGGGTCSSASLNTTYAVSISGRQVTSAGNFTSILQANGSATFDGLSKVTLTLTAGTNQALGMPLNWSGSYSVQANCAAVVTITSGGTATLNVMVYNQGKDFELTGSDATYSYTGSGVTQPSGCSITTMNGAYTFAATGFSLNATSVNGVANGAGLLQFDGQGNMTASVSRVVAEATTSVLTLSGSYTVTSDCLGSATLTDSNSHSYAMSFSIYSVAAANTSFYATLAQAEAFLMSGGGHTASSGTCAASDLNGTYSLTLSGRAISSAGEYAGSVQEIGTATFDGQGNVTLAGTDNTNVAQGTPFSYQGTYALPPNCDGAVTLTSGNTAAFTLVVWSSATQFNIVGSDANYVYSGSGTNNHPVCATPTLSGEYTYTASGFTSTGAMQNTAQDEAGVLQFDGQGNVTATFTDTQSGMSPVSIPAPLSGTYTVTSNCFVSAALHDASGDTTVFYFVILGVYGENLDLLADNLEFVRTGSAHSAFVNPSQGIGNVASYAYSATPPGSVFALFGENLASKADTAITTPIPTKLLNTTVTVNGELAPLFYVSTGQIDAQMPWDIPGNSVASVIVTSGTSASNAAAVYVPATGTPGINSLGNRAPVVNADGTVNSAGNGAKVGDEVVVYFTGGGPVDASGKLTTGDPSPAGLSPVTGDNSITVGGAQAQVVYMGLSPGSVGLYQANFIVPQLAKGSYAVIVTIAGYASNNPVMTVSN
ncbi:MAG TPA: hypothetical protein VME17_25300 [Bryobacteraceae bacterium]|nr:hypothetical protein [Bryobacteraceae bacterium]